LRVVCLSAWISTGYSAWRPKGRLRPE
jgi:hypothetical protein